MVINPKEEMRLAAIRGLYDYREDIPEIVEKLVEIHNDVNNFDRESSEPVPSRDAIIRIIHQFRRILFPGYFAPVKLDKVSLQYYLGQEAVLLFEQLSHQITLCLKSDNAGKGLPASIVTNKAARRRSDS